MSNLKKISLLFGLLILLTPSVSFAEINQYLVFGSRSSQVSELQQFLLDQGSYAGPVTGYFGVMTRAAVKEFQASQNISTTGTIGPVTRKVIADMRAKMMLKKVACEQPAPPVGCSYVPAPYDPKTGCSSVLSCPNAPMCEQPAPPEGCSYVPAPYDPKTGCSSVLSCTHR